MWGLHTELNGEEEGVGTTIVGRYSANLQVEI